MNSSQVDEKWGKLRYNDENVCDGLKFFLHLFKKKEKRKKNKTHALQAKY